MKEYQRRFFFVEGAGKQEKRKEMEKKSKKVQQVCKLLHEEGERRHTRKRGQKRHFKPL